MLHTVAQTYVPHTHTHLRVLTQQQFNHLSIQFNRTTPQSVLVADLSFNAKSKRVKLHIKHTPRSSNICAKLRQGASSSITAAATTSATPIAVVAVRTPPLRAPRLQVKLRVKLHVLRHVATPYRAPPVRLPQLVSNLSLPTAVPTTAAVLKQIQQKIYLENCRRSAFVLH